MREALRSGRVTRRYRALVAGRIAGPIEIATPIAHHAKNARKMVVVEASETTSGAGPAKVTTRYRSTPRPAFTQVEPLSYQNGFTLLTVTPRTGSRHQIRVHLASIGNPIAGDELYGGPQLAGLAAGRFWLHLVELEFEPPWRGRVEAVAPLPSDLEGSLARLRS
jgi:23S rRNA pseudouridine1911/1915/1917 synthase